MKPIKLIILFLLIATTNVNAQKSKPSKEEYRIILAQEMSTFVEDITSIIQSEPTLFFKKNTKEVNFKNLTFPNLLFGLGMDPKKMTKEGKNLMFKAYQFIKSGTTSKSIMVNYNGKEYLSVLKSYYQAENSNKNNVVNNVFGVQSIKNLKQLKTSTNKNASGCCWICIRCKLAYRALRRHPELQRFLN